MRMFAAVVLLAVASALHAAEAGPATRPGGAIVFSSNRSGTWAIWTIRADGSGLQQMTKPAKDEKDIDPSWWSRGILFTSTRGGTTGTWTMDAEGKKPERICDGDQAEASIDGGRIALRRDGKIIVRDQSTGKEKEVSPEGWDKCSGPAWSPDGAAIAFAHLEDEGNVIYTIPADGGKPTKVFGKQGACEPHFSPDGKRLVYETETHLCTINPDGTKNRLATWFGGVQRYARWNPDGTKLVFCQAAAPEGPWELYIIPVAGGEPQRLTEGGSDLFPDWR